MAFFGVALKLYIHHKRQNIRSLFCSREHYQSIYFTICILYYLYTNILSNYSKNKKNGELNYKQFSVPFNSISFCLELRMFSCTFQT